MPLFVGYTFVLIQLQWHAARWAPGTLGLIMDGERPARVPDAVIAEIRDFLRRPVDFRMSRSCSGQDSDRPGRDTRRIQ